MNNIDNNQFEIKKTKRKIPTGPNVYLNPALDLLANEDPMCNTAMEITPNKKRKCTKSSEIAAFENTALDLGISKAAVNEFLQRELNNVRKNIKNDNSINCNNTTENLQEEPIYANLTDIKGFRNDETDTNRQYSEGTVLDKADENELDSGISVLEQKSLNTATFNSELDTNDISAINTTNIQTNVTNQIFVNNNSSLSLSFIDRLALESPANSNQSLYLDDDLNESNIMEIKTITIITKKKYVQKKSTNPFLDPNLNINEVPLGENPFLEETNPELEYNMETMQDKNVPPTHIFPRKLFVSETNSTISTVNESSVSHDYENIDSYRSESPIYENVSEDMETDMINKQSKILGYDVSHFSAVDILNLNKSSRANNSNESNDSKKDLKHILKVSNKLSKKVFKTLKKKFKGEKVDPNVTLNPYEVPRKPPKIKVDKKPEPGIENPALNLDNSDDIEIEELDDEEHQYETIKTIRNTQLNTNITPLKEKVEDNYDNSHNKTYTPSKKVRFDSTLNKEKVITGNSFDCDIQSPGFDSKIDKYHDELENCINERKFLQQNM